MWELEAALDPLYNRLFLYSADERRPQNSIPAGNWKTKLLRSGIDDYEAGLSKFAATSVVLRRPMWDALPILGAGCSCYIDPNPDVD